MGTKEFIESFIKERKEVEFFKGDYPTIKNSPHTSGRYIKFITLTTSGNILVKFCYPQETIDLNELSKDELNTIYQRLKLIANG